MISPPRISIVTSSFNHARFIARTIESVRAQDYPNVEHIVVDGMSTDGTADILAAFPHLTVIREKDRGQADAINKGFRIATGEILGFLNSDDTLEPGALRAIVDEMEGKAGRHIVMGRCRFIDEDDRFLGVEHPSAFESHRRILEIWKGHCVPQPAVFWTRTVWDTCGPLATEEALMLDYDLFCRFSRRYAFHRLDRVLANYRLHTQSKTSSVTDAERLEQAITVSRRYWGSPFSHQYWRILGSYAAFRLNRRVRAVGWLRAGRDRSREGRRVRGLGRMLAGAALAPDVVVDVVLLPAVRQLVSRMRGRTLLPRRRRVGPQTEAYFSRTTLHDDRWAGPTVVMGLSVERPPSRLALKGHTMTRRLPSPLQLEAFLDGRSLGRRPVTADAFSLVWRVADTAAGRHELRIVANTFMVPHHSFGSQDYRPLSYCVTRIELEDDDGVRGSTGSAAAARERSTAS